MLSTSELLEWLSAANRRYAAAEVPHRGRPFQAMSDFTREYNCAISLDDPTAKRIFDWFYQHSPPGAHQIGSAYTGIFLHDAAFWPVSIPLIFGQVNVDALDSLETMPQQIKRGLETDHSQICSYVIHWENCVDYGYGQMDLESGTVLRPRALKFLGAGHSELIGANTQLLERRPNVKAILGLRMATEIFLKTALIQQLDLTDSHLIKLSHRLEDSSNACAEATKESTFAEVAKRVSLFPPVSARYEDTDWSISLVWQAAALTQLVAATVTRLYTERDIRASIRPAR